MPTESKTLTEQWVRKERVLASLREMQLAEAKLLRADQAEAAIKVRNGMLAIPMRCAAQFADPDMQIK